MNLSASRMDVTYLSSTFNGSECQEEKGNKVLFRLIMISYETIVSICWFLLECPNMTHSQWPHFLLCVLD